MNNLSYRAPRRFKPYLPQQKVFCTRAKEMWVTARWLLRGIASHQNPDRTLGTAFVTLDELAAKRQRLAAELDALRNSRHVHDATGTRCPDCLHIGSAVGQALAVTREIEFEQRAINGSAEIDGEPDYRLALMRRLTAVCREAFAAPARLGRISAKKMRQAEVGAFAELARRNNVTLDHLERCAECRAARETLYAEWLRVREWLHTHDTPTLRQMSATDFNAQIVDRRYRRLHRIVTGLLQKHDVAASVEKKAKEDYADVITAHFAHV